MGSPPLIPVGASHWGGADTLLARSFVDVGFRDDELVDVDVFGFVLHVGDGGVQHLLDDRRDALVGIAQRGAGVIGLLPADQVDHQPRLLRGDADVSGFCFGFHMVLYAGLAFVSVAAFTECPLNWRVGENSPSLWPTMFSVTYTGMNFFPLCTATVWPTNSGRMVERRDQVRTTFFSLAAFRAYSFFSRCPSVNGPFFTDRPIF